MIFSDRYNAFQQEAVENIVADFREDIRGKYLLVIPTGGGKTTTAVKAVSDLFSAGLLNRDENILWVVHRDELRTQAMQSFEKFAQESDQQWLPARVRIEMLSGIKSFLEDNPSVRFAVIDEAHHAAANSYQPLFEKPNMGILGLTATPSRHDGKPLQFSKESYSIGFPDLVQMGVLIKPTVIRVVGGTYDIDDISSDSDSLEIFNNSERNAKIISALKENKSKLNKIIIYAGTRNHAHEIYKLLKSSPDFASYEAISLILSGERVTYNTVLGAEINDENRQNFIANQKKYGRSIIVNVDVLTEGYDDPSVNAIVMARPTNSKLVYMQALGRAVRIDPENEGKEAYVIEVEDVLPNITYRIDNRWLYSDISDLLEPEVLDISYTSNRDLEREIKNIFRDQLVIAKYESIPNFLDRDRITLLLFKVYLGNKKYGKIPLLISNSTRQSAAGFFNFLADRMDKIQGLDIERIINPVRSQMSVFETLQDVTARKLIVNAMENAWELVAREHDKCTESVVDGHPWITFVAFRKRMEKSSLSEDIINFTEDMQNKEEVRDSLLTDSIDLESTLVKFPLPLKGSWGIFLWPAEFSKISTAVKELEEISVSMDGQNQWHNAVAVVGGTTAFVEQRHLQGLTTIVRENIDYFRHVCDCRKES